MTPELVALASVVLLAWVALGACFWLATREVWRALVSRFAAAPGPGCEERTSGASRREAKTRPLQVVSAGA